MEAIKRQIAEAKNQLVKEETTKSETDRDISIRRAGVADREQAVAILTKTSDTLYRKTVSQKEEMNTLTELNDDLQEEKNTSRNKIFFKTDEKNALYAENIVIVEKIKSIKTKTIALWEENREINQSISEKTEENEQLRIKISECRA